MSTMSTRQSMPRLGMGTWAFSGDVWGEQPEADSTAAVLEALDRGCTLIDTAQSYGSGRSERIVGAAVKGRRGDVEIVTKVPPRNEVWGPPPEQPIGDGYDAAWIRDCCEQSLRNLGTDHVDTLLLHTWSRGWPVDGEWRDALEELKQAGKIRGYGISVDDLGASDADAAIDAGLDAVQLVYNVFYQEAAEGTLEQAAAAGTAVIARSPLQAGILTGKYQDRAFPAGDWRADWTPDDWLEQNRSMVREVTSIADEFDMTIRELALRFALSQPKIDTVIVGCRTREQAAENFSAAAREALAPGLLGRLTSLWSDGTVRGTYLGSS